MVQLLYKNNAQSTLAGSITNTATTANLQSGTGVLFPDPGVNQAYYGTFTDAATGLLREIVLVTDMTGDTITTMVRGQQGTSARPWAANDLFAKLWTEGDAEAGVQVTTAQAQAFNYAVDTGSANSYVATLSPNPGAPVVGMPFRVKIANANTGASTLNSIGIRRRNGSALIGGELPANTIIEFNYDGTFYQIPGVAPATAAAITAGSDTQSAVTPAQLNAALGTAKLLGGQCRFVWVNAGNCTLFPYNGNNIAVAGANVSIPAAGVSVSNVGITLNGSGGQTLAANAGYLAAFNGTTIEWWTLATGHSPDTTAGNIGVEVITGHPTKTLVGQVFTDSSGNFQDSDALLFVLSWFNRKRKVSKTNLSGTITATTTLVELDSTSRNAFIVWGGENVDFANTGSVTAGGSGQLAMTGIGFDAVTAELQSAVFSGMHTSTEGSSTVGSSAFSGTKIGLSEGNHYATLLGVASGGSVGWTSGTAPIDASDPPPNTLQVSVYG